MQPAQIRNAVKEVYELCLASSHPASEVISSYIRNRRYIGSKDRKALTEMVWRFLRFKAHTDWYLQTGKTLDDLLDMPFQDEEKMPDWVKLECPQWLLPHIPDAQNELKAMQEPAPTILRANGNRKEIIQKLAQEGITAQPTKQSPFGLILDKRYHLNTSKAYQEGLIEVQDEGSQLIALETEIAPHQTVFDMCAGAGGKSLIFAQMMNNTGHITAFDVSARSLMELAKRAHRAHATQIEPSLTFPTEPFDVVVIDTPCSGTGTMRRAPDAKWKLTQEHFEKLLKTQAELLEKAVPLVKNKLCYMTCSLTTDENEMQVEAFLSKHPDFKLIRQKRFSPYLTQTDGFFVAIMVKN